VAKEGVRRYSCGLSTYHAAHAREIATTEEPDSDEGRRGDGLNVSKLKINICRNTEISQKGKIFGMKAMIFSSEEAIM